MLIDESIAHTPAETGVCMGGGRWRSMNFALVSLALASSGTAEVTIFRCVLDGVVAFSDRPCGTQPQKYVPDDALISTVSAPPASMPTVPPVKPARAGHKQAASIAASQAKLAEKCTRIERSMRDVRSKMRAGYDVRQGERLRERQRKLMEERRALRC